MKSSELKYPSSDFTGDLKEDIEVVELAYNRYKADKEDEIKYIRLEKAVYDLSITIKCKLVENTISKEKAEKLKEYFWGLIC